MKINELKKLKNSPVTTPNKIQEIKEVLNNLNFNEKNKDKDKLLKKIENSRIIYNRKEPINIALKRAFILANKFEDTLDLAKKSKLSKKLLIRAYMKEYNEVSKYPVKKLDKFIVDKHRLYRFNTCKWSIETLYARNLGVWPSFGGIDKFTTNGNLIDTKEKIIDIIRNTNKYKRPVKANIPVLSWHRLILEKKLAPFVYRFYPIIVTTKGPNTRRVKMNKWCKKKYGFGYKITPYDIEDGSHRAMALVMFGLRKIKCFVGRGLVTDMEK